jgi:methionine sulfoxide reductase heme-binding subunit
MDRIEKPELALILGATLLNAGIAACLLQLAGSDVAGTELALRTTARVSFFWFMLAFVAAPLQALRPARWSAWLVRRRRALGVIFGLSMSIHVAFISRLFALHAPARPPMVTDADFFIGIPGLVMVALLTITSAESLKQRLGSVAWKRLHTTGIWVVWTIFFLCLVDSVGRKATAHPVLAYHAFIAVLILGMALRLLAASLRNGMRTPPLVTRLASALQFSGTASGTFPSLEKGAQGGLDQKIPLDPPFPKGEAQGSKRRSS